MTSSDYTLPIDAEAFDSARAITLAQACQRIFRGHGGRHLYKAIARRWVTRGLRIDGGHLLRLPARCVNGIWYTMPEWCHAFEAKRLELERLGLRKDQPPCH